MKIRYIYFITMFLVCSCSQNDIRTIASTNEGNSIKKTKIDIEATGGDAENKINIENVVQNQIDFYISEIKKIDENIESKQEEIDKKKTSQAKKNKLAAEQKKLEEKKTKMEDIYKNLTELKLME